MKPLTSRLRVATILSLLVAILTVAYQSPSLATSSPEQRMASFLNQARVDAGLRPLTLSEGLSKISHRHSVAMADSGTIWHTKNLARVLRDYRWNTAGENVGYGPSLKALNDAFMGSKPHRANVLSTRYRRMGVGVVERQGDIFVTFTFLG